MTQLEDLPEQRWRNWRTNEGDFISVDKSWPARLSVEDLLKAQRHREYDRLMRQARIWIAISLVSALSSFGSMLVIWWMRQS